MYPATDVETSSTSSFVETIKGSKAGKAIQPHLRWVALGVVGLILFFTVSKAVIFIALLIAYAKYRKTPTGVRRKAESKERYRNIMKSKEVRKLFPTSTTPGESSEWDGLNFTLELQPHRAAIAFHLKAPTTRQAVKAKEQQLISVFDAYSLEWRELDGGQNHFAAIMTLQPQVMNDLPLHQFPLNGHSMWDDFVIGQAITPAGTVEPLVTSMRDCSYLLGGIPGSGKSTAAHILIAQAAMDPGCFLALMDPKMTEAVQWQDRADAYWTADNSWKEQAAVVLNLVARCREAQHAAVDSENRESNDFRALLYIDEAMLAFQKPQDKDDQKHYYNFVQGIEFLVSTGRAFGIVTVIATQKPDGDTLKTSIRDLLSDRIALRTTTPQMSDVILGSGSASSGFNSAAMETVDKGCCVFRLSSMKAPAYGRVHGNFVNDAYLKATASYAAKLRRRPQ